MWNKLRLTFAASSVALTVACGGGGSSQTPAPVLVSVTCPNGTTQAAATQALANSACPLPLLVSVSPTNANAAVSVDTFASVNVVTDSTLDATSIAVTSVTLKAGTTVVAGTATTVGTKGFKFAPTAKLSYAQPYTFAATIKDSLGRSLVVNSTFTTALISCVSPQIPNSTGNACADPAFASQPTLLPDLRTEYQTVCGTVSPFHVGVQSATVLNMAGHKDGKKDLIFTLWCGQQPGTVYSGPTKNGAVFFEQTNTGQFINVTRQRFGIDLVDVGGVATNSLAYDFNHDGFEDVVLAITGEDGRAEPLGYSGNNRQNFFLTSTASGQYSYQSQGWASYSVSIAPLDNELSGIDVITGTIGYGGKPQAWRYSNQWVALSGYDWVGPNTFFFRKRPGEMASSTALDLRNLTANLRTRSSPTSDWLQKDSFGFPARLQVPWVSWQNSQYLVDLISIDGKDYVGSSFQAGCEIKPTPNSNPVALVLFTGYQLDQSYVSGPVVEGVGMSSTVTPIAFTIVGDKLQRFDLQVVGWEKSVSFFAMKCADVNNDGNDDFVVFPGVGGSGAKPLIFLNDGNGKFSLVDRSIFPDPPPFYSVTTATFEDIDGDGIRDLIYRPLAVDFTKFSSSPVQFVIYPGRRPLAVKDLK